MHNLKCSLFAAIFSLFLLPTSFAWNALGHEVIAQIAYDHLKPNVKIKVDNLIGTFHQSHSGINSFIEAAPWADQVREYAHWHYIDNGFTIDNTPLIDLRDQDNALWAFDKVLTAVKDQNANVSDRAWNFAFLIHIIGDLHQPLHTVSLISALHPNGDRGGNDYFVRYHGDRTKLHKLWDGGIKVFGKDDSINSVKYVAATISNAYPEQSFGDVTHDLVPEHWVNEGIETAKRYAYSAEEEKNISDAYIQTGKETAEKRAALAGYRLAALLNDLFGREAS